VKLIPRFHLVSRLKSHTTPPLLVYLYLRGTVHMHIGNFILKEFYLVGYKARKSGRSQPTFRRNMSLVLPATNFMLISWLSYYLILKIEAIISSEKSVDFHQTSRWFNPEDGSLHRYLISKYFIFIFIVFLFLTFCELFPQKRIYCTHLSPKSVQRGSAHLAIPFTGPLLPAWCFK
jgi:hypothetical protein